MEIVQEKQVDINVFRIKGRLDSMTSPEFEEKIAEAAKNGNSKMVLDFGELEYISSAGLRVVLKAAKDMKLVGGSVVLCSMQDYVKEVFEIAGFDTFLPIVPSFEDAVKKF
jgi:anti-sigma B factor antagonist